MTASCTHGGAACLPGLGFGHASVLLLRWMQVAWPLHNGHLGRAVGFVLRVRLGGICQGVSHAPFSGAFIMPVS